MKDPRRSRTRVFGVLALLSLVVYVGVVFGLVDVYHAERSRFANVAVDLYLPLTGVWVLLMVSLPFGYDSSRTPLVAIGWGLLLANLAALSALIARWDARALAFVVVVVANVVLLRVLRSERLKAAVVLAAEGRKSRYPEGFGLVAIACIALLLGSWAAAILVAQDLRDPDAGRRAAELGVRIVIGLGVAIDWLVIVLCRRTRVPFLAVLALGLFVSAGHLPVAIAASPVGDSTSRAPGVIIGTLASALGLLLATGSRFREFWIQLPKYDWFPPVEKALAQSARQQKKRRHR